MSRSPAYLAALASSAVPGLDPVAVRAARTHLGDRCAVGFVTDTQHRAWVVRVPSTPAVGAQLDGSVALLPLVAKRVPYAVPSPRGYAPVPEGRAMVYPYLHGRSVVLSEVTPGPGLAAEIGIAVAALHNVDPTVYEEAAVPVYEAEACQSRRLADLDRAAATGHVPTSLLGRWERALEDVALWKFAPVATHGGLDGGRLLVGFGDEEDATTADVRAVTGWDDARVADPADDLAAFVGDCSPEAFESILEAYSVARIERPDRQLRVRSRLVSELRYLRRLLAATASGDSATVDQAVADLRALDERIVDAPRLVPLGPPPPEQPEPRPTPRTEAPGVADQGDDADADDGDVEKAEGEDVDEEDTQVLHAGEAADATTVIDLEGAPDATSNEPDLAEDDLAQDDLAQVGADEGAPVTEPVPVHPHPRADPPGDRDR